MFKSLLKELVGIPTNPTEDLETLGEFRGKCHVLVLFEGSDDDRPEVQERYMENQQSALEAKNVSLLRVAGGGVFSSLDSPLDISADDIRSDLNGPSPEEFEAVLVDKQGHVILRSPTPVELPMSSH